MPHRAFNSLIVLAGATTLVLTVCLVLLTPDIAEARPPCGEPYNCVCEDERQTPMVWGMGADCAEAFQDAVDQARDLFVCETTCSETFVVTTACWTHDGMSQVDAYMLYECKDCMVDPCFPEV